MDDTLDYMENGNGWGDLEDEENPPARKRPIKEGTDWADGIVDLFD